MQIPLVVKLRIACQLGTSTPMSLAQTNCVGDGDLATHYTAIVGEAKT